MKIKDIKTLSGQDIVLLHEDKRHQTLSGQDIVLLHEDKRHQNPV